MKIHNEFFPAHSPTPQAKSRIHGDPIQLQWLNLEYKEAGIGFKYTCLDDEVCEIDLHKACALAPTSLYHPFYKKCLCQLHNIPLGLVLRLCDACHNEVQGFAYHCKRCGFDLHPCCVNLPQVLNDGERDLYLHIKLSRPCHYCGRKGQGWACVCECKMYNLHVSCVKKTLLESWEAKYLNLDENKVREFETSVPCLKGSLTRNNKSSRILSKCCDYAGNTINIKYLQYWVILQLSLLRLLVGSLPSNRPSSEDN